MVMQRLRQFAVVQRLAGRLLVEAFISLFSQTLHKAKHYITIFRT
jgi:hypothetical protein